MPETLYSSTTLAKALGVVPSALTNWRNRGSGPELPEPAYQVIGPSGRPMPLWTREQLDKIIADRIAGLSALLDEVAP